MFERRVRIVLIALVLVAVGLLVRAVQVQVAQAGHWRTVASETLRRSELTETTRGRILDVKGRVLAADEPCNDAAVAYWFITEKPDEDRLYRDVARKLARTATPNYASLSRDEQHALVLSFMPQARQQLEDMWDTLAELGGVSRADIDATRREIVEKVEGRRRQVVLNRYDRSLQEHTDQGVSPWWQRWLLGEADAPPEMAEFEEAIAEELQAHVVLPDISVEAYNELRKREDELPGLSILASRTRHYPGGNVTAHLVGFMNAVESEDLRQDPEMDNGLRAYLPLDTIGRSGLELVGERVLRGSRGRIDRDMDSQEESVGVEKVPGEDLRTTIDLSLQSDLRNALLNVNFEWPAEPGETEKLPDPGPFPGAIVLIDVKTGAIIALVSYPDYDPNFYRENVGQLFIDDINRPLRSRATQFATVPGSTVKPIVGLAAITEGLIEPEETVECVGHFYLNGKKWESLRCWTASMHGRSGHAGHPYLTLSDALERSCNVYFVEMAKRLGEQRLTKWMRAFGLGSTTGIGLPEQEGMLLDYLRKDGTQNIPIYNLLAAGIGQGHVQATPLQVANVAATLARGGVFIRPTLLQNQTAAAVKEARNLGLDPEALQAVRRGMAAAVQSPNGTGNSINKTLPVPIAGKTGSAQAHPLWIPVRDENGVQKRDAEGKKLTKPLEVASRDNPNPFAPWYRRTSPMSDPDPHLAHGWYIGYLPADNPQIAFAVFVEYGGSGGSSAGSVVTQMVDALVKHGYINPTRERDPDAAPGELKYVVE